MTVVVPGDPAVVDDVVVVVVTLVDVVVVVCGPGGGYVHTASVVVMSMSTRAEASCVDVDGPSAGVLIDLVTTAVVVVVIVVVVVPASCSDGTKSEVDERFDKRVGRKAGRLEMLSRRAIGLLRGPLIVTVNHAISTAM